MTNVWVRPFNHRDEVEWKTLVEWLYNGRDKNRFDPKLFERGADGKFLRCRVLTCFTDEGIIGFIPVTVSFLLESLAFKPGLHPHTEAKALQAMQHWLVHQASEQNVSDAYFASTDPSVLSLAQRYGWREPVVPILNLHFENLETKRESND